jgi:signal transduction histidine kinase
VRNASGVLFDPDPGRLSDLAMPNFAPLNVAALEDMSDSAVLDSLFPVLLARYPGLSRGENTNAIAIYFASVNQVHRYYPVIGIQDIADPATDVTPRMLQVGPEGNPGRTTYWTTPYPDNAGQGFVITAYTPVYEGDVFRGVIGVDLSLAKLISNLNLLRPTPGGFTFYMDRGGGFLPSASIPLLDQEIADGNLALQEAFSRMRAGDRSVARVSLGGEEFFIAYAPFGNIGGSFAVAAPVSELTEQAAGIATSIEAEGNRTLRLTLAAMGAIFCVGLVAATYLNRRVLIRPLEALVSGTHSVSVGRLDTVIEVKGKDELSKLAHSFNNMTTEIRERRDSLEAQVQERTQELRALLDISQNFATALELRPLLQLLMAQIGTVVDYSQSSLFLVEGEALRRLNSALVGTEARSGGDEPLLPLKDLQPMWQEIESGKAVIIDDLRADSAMARAWQSAAADFSQSASDAGSILAVPVRLKDQTIGMLTLSSSDCGFYKDNHAHLLQAIASQAGVAVENARLYEQARKVAAIEERQRLARDLHDSVSQALYGIALSATAARTMLDQDAAAAKRPIDYVMTLAQAAMAEMRALIFELRPESLETEGLVAALTKQVAAVEARHGIAVEAVLDEEPRVTLAVKEVLYRVCQEALHNVVKHADASTVRVSLMHSNGWLSLEVKDNGVGFDTAQQFPGHIGLVSMPERAATIGATYEVTSAPGEGTTIRISARLVQA